MKNNIKNQKALLVSFIATTIVFCVCFITLAVLLIILLNKHNQVSNNPSIQGLYPSIGLGRMFPEAKFEYYVEQLGVTLQQLTQTPMYGDRIRALILDNYTLVGETYYYNSYLQANPPSMSLITLLAVIAVITLIFTIISGLSLLKYKQSVHKKEEIQVKDIRLLTILSAFSLNLFAFFVLLKERMKNK